MSPSRSSWAVDAASPWWTERIPTSSVCLRLLPTYTCEAGSSPTRTVARPGMRPPWLAASSRTAAATRARTSAATALPSMTITDWFPLGPSQPPSQASRSPTVNPAQGRVVGHQLALAGVRREAHDDDPARLDARDHALAEG